MRPRISIVFILLVLGYTSIVSQPCLPDGITFTTQSQIDSFQINYPNCTEIEGDVIIGVNSGTDITNLHGLSALTSVGGKLEIWRLYNINDLAGLNNLTSIFGDLILNENSGLTDLSGLDSLSYIGGSLTILGNDGLVNLFGLNNVSFIGANVWICYNDAMTNLSGLNNLTAIHGNLNIGDSEWTHISGNTSLSSLEGIGNITNVEGDLEIHLNGSLKDLADLNNLTTIEGDLKISNNDSLTSLAGLGALVSTGGLWIMNNPLLMDVNAMESLSYIEQDLVVVANQSLQNLFGLYNLTSVNGIGFIDNLALASLEGLNNIAYETISILKIEGNPILSECEVKSVCDYLAASTGTVIIDDNSMGCNSQQEVEDACESIGIPEPESAIQLSVYPNPFTTSTTIEFALDGKSKIQISIFNTIGEEVFYKENYLDQGTHHFSWSPHHLPAGLYFAVLRSEEGVSVVKLIKQ